MNENYTRKDNNPKETIKTIKAILDTYGIKTKVVSNLNYKELWFSNRIEFLELNGIGTNGKGISEDYALASGYAEFIERLQSGMLIDDLYLDKHREHNDSSRFNLSYIANIFNTYFKEYLKDTSLNSETSINNIISIKNGQYINLKKYFDVSNKKIIFLPERFIMSICGSNGLASGNSKEEAFTQGVCEIFERYINKLIYFNKISNIPTIPKKYYENTNLYKIINEIERQGYTVIVKDCTLNGTLPVLGLLVMNFSKTKYYFKLGSDINIDICLQRCITEMFQGLDFSTVFKLNMKSLEEDIYDKFWNLNDMLSEYYKTVRNGTGNLPRTIFKNFYINYNNNNISPFINYKMNNIETTKILLEIISNLQKNIYIKDYSYLKFNTLRIFIPGMSEIIYYNKGLINTQFNLQETKRLYNNCSLKLEIKEIEELENSLHKLLGENLISYDYSLSNLLGICTNLPENSLLKKNIFYFASLISLYLGNYEKSYEYIKKYCNFVNLNSRKIKLIYLIFQSIINDISYDDLKNYIEFTTTENEKHYVIEIFNFLNQIKNKNFSFDSCNKCVTCSIKEYCKFENWNSIYKRISPLKTKYEVYYNYSDSFYENLNSK